MIIFLEITTQVSLWDKVAVSGPLAAFQLIVIAGMYTYFKKEIEKKDAIIKHKDDAMAQLNNKFVEITERFLTVTMKSNDIIEGMKEWLKDTLKK